MSLCLFGGKIVLVRYHSRGKRAREWEQKLLADTDEMIVSTFIFKLPEPFSPEGKRQLIKDGYYGVLFELMDRWFNVVKIYDKNKTHLGYYSDIRTPPERIEGGYTAEDLYLDFWVELNGEYILLDKEEFQEAYLTYELRKKALETADKLKQMIEENDYPPKIVRDFKISADEIGNR